MSQPSRTSRERYRAFVKDYHARRLDDLADNGEAPATPKPAEERRGRRREYLRDYLRWLRPHRVRIAVVFVFALMAAGLEMIEPLFMRFIIDRVLLNDELSTHLRLVWLHAAGALFLTVIIGHNVIGALKDYRQRLLNVRVMLSLRRSLFHRLLHLPLPKVWDMKTGGILSRLTGDVETTTGLLQMALVSPAISVIRLVIAVAVLFTLNWRLALTAMAIIPGAMLMSFVFARRVRPIYRSVRKHLFAQDRVAARHVIAQLEQLAAKRAHHANPGKRFPHPPVDVLHVLPRRPINRPHATRENEAHQHRARNDRHGRKSEPPVQREEHANRNEQPDDRNCRRHTRELEEAGRGLHIAGEPREHAAGFHVPHFRQRQVE
ncbi:MAG TPA: ABC transporter ATP-binding protein [Opitutaceae bacterium]|nr:ABC transporter ATP-binding protein [Opitutaceae bacterium]